MTLHSYRNGVQTLGRQVLLLLPIEWTADGWYKVRDCVSAGNLIAKSHLELESAVQIASAFTGINLDPQWQFWMGYDLNRLRLADDSLTLAADGDSIETTSPLTRAAMHADYTVEVDIEMAHGCEAGLILFYDSTHSCGLRLTSDPNAKSRSKTFLVRGGRATLRVVNSSQVADF